MKWLLLVALVLLAGCSTASPRDYFTAATVGVAQANDSAARGRELSAQQTRDAITPTSPPTWTPQPSATPIPTATPEPTATSTPQPTATATATATVGTQGVARAEAAATDSAGTQASGVESEGQGDSSLFLMLGVVGLLIVLIAGRVQIMAWARKYMRW